MQRTDAIAKLKQSRAVWDLLIAEVPDDMFETPVQEDGWTIKSIVAHVDFYEWWAGEFFRKKDWPEVDPRLNTWDVDQRNDAMNDMNRNRPLAEVLAESPGMHQHLVAALEGMTDDEFNDPGLLGQDDEHDWSALNMIAGNSWEHYDQHAPEIRAWLTTFV